MKFFFDLLPVILFFAAFKLAGIYVATAVAIAASVIQVAYLWWRHRRVETMHLVTMGLILVLGGATLLLHDETFIKWKPSVVNWAFAAAFLISQYWGERPLVRRMLDSKMVLPDATWTRLNLSWVIFFTALGAANLVVAYTVDTATWVNFKLFGMMGLTFLFVIGQAVFLSRHLVDEEPEKSPMEGP